MVTSIYAAILGLMLISLAINVIKARRKYGAGLGDGNQLVMKRCIRAHANLAEYAPMFLLLLGYAEYNNLPGWAVNLFGVIFIVGRVMHAYSLLKAEEYANEKLTSNPVWRVRGMMCTFAAIGVLSIILLMQAVLVYL